MERTIIEFDAAFFWMTAFEWQIDVRGKAGSQGITGTGQVVYGAQPRWVAPLDFDTFDRSRILPWRSILAQVRGRVHALRVHVQDPLRPSFRDIGYSTQDAQLVNQGLVPFDDDELFDDGTGFTQEVATTVTATAAVGATSLTFDIDALGDTFDGGHMFSINDWLYQAVSVEDGTVTFEPPLRRAVIAGDEINLNPTALMVLEGDLEGASRITPNNIASPSLKLVEWVGPDRD